LILLPLRFQPERSRSFQPPAAAARWLAGHASDIEPLMLRAALTPAAFSRGRQPGYAAEPEASR